MKKILLLLADGFEIFEASAFIDVMGWNLEEGDGSTILHTSGLSNTITSTFNQKLIVDYVINEIDINDYDALAIPGGFEQYHFYEQAFSEPFLEVIRKFREKGSPIASICTGALPIAKSGILNHKKGTTYNKNPLRQDMLKEMGVNVISKAIVTDDDITTSWNPSTAVDVALLLLERLTSAQNAKKVRELMGF
ncbi:DJ-1/PfpI family protein [Winogradskyella maritima]|uniref:DJ-1/PfpI family protein n=1 Tax=Winogradskyella maritima TaxID=1517766 RepID=A0ABV8AJK1_9FLAO|nr:DJ-1/PfpI family protein [Winogradskyella maritima]